MQVFLETFKLASENDEINFILSSHYKMLMECYSENVYPFKIYPQKQFFKIDFEPITIFYGGNGSGKSTILNIIAEKLHVTRVSAFNNTPFFEEYIKFCSYKTFRDGKIPLKSRIITSDDVFDFLLDCRVINQQIEKKRENIFAEYDTFTDPHEPNFQMKSLDDYFELKSRNEARNKSKSEYVKRRIPMELQWKSNGESAFAYFTSQIKENALYILDEPENSLSPKLQLELSKFIENSARFYNCQFIISTHSPFILGVKSAKIYDLDSIPVVNKKWTELENIKIYKEFFSF